MKFAYAILILPILFTAGCVTVGDGLTNKLDKRARVSVLMTDGQKLERLLEPGGSWVERRRSSKDGGLRYSRVALLDSEGHEESAIGVEDVPNKRGVYGKWHRFAVTPVGILPVPQTKHGPEQEFSVDELVRFFEAERQHDQK